MKKGPRKGPLPVLPKRDSQPRLRVRRTVHPIANSPIPSSARDAGSGAALNYWLPSAWNTRSAGEVWRELNAVPPNPPGFVYDVCACPICNVDVNVVPASAGFTYVVSVKFTSPVSVVEFVPVVVSNDCPDSGFTVPEMISVPSV